MQLEFHIFASDQENLFTVRQEDQQDVDEGRQFASLSAAMSHLRGRAQENDGCVVIHDEEGHPNRIPLHPQG